MNSYVSTALNWVIFHTFFLIILFVLTFFETDVLIGFPLTLLTWVSFLSLLKRDRCLGTDLHLACCLLPHLLGPLCCPWCQRRVIFTCLFHFQSSPPGYTATSTLTHQVSHQAGRAFLIGQYRKVLTNLIGLARFDNSVLVEDSISLRP
jgi:hypothetical protein